MSLLNLHIYDPLPAQGDAQVVDLNPSITRMRFSTKLPGGFNTLDVGMDDPGGGPRMWLPDPVNLKHFAHVELRAGYQTRFQGQVMVRSRPGGGITGFQAEGYGVSALADDVWINATSGGGTSGLCLAAVLAQCAPLIRVPGDSLHFVDPRTAHVYSDFNAMTGADVVNQLVREGGTANAPWDFAVWESEAGPLATFLPRQQPAVPDYWVPWSPDIVQQWDEDAHDLYGSVFMQYTVPGATSVSYTTTTNTSAFTAQYGRYRRKLVKGSTMAATVAQQFQETFRIRAAQPAVQAKLLVNDANLARPGGAPVPADQPRAGQWVQVGDSPMQIIIQTDYDYMTAMNTLTLGAYPRGWFDALYNAQALVANAVSNTNPLTGAPKTAN